MERGNPALMGTSGFERIVEGHSLATGTARQGITRCARPLREGPCDGSLAEASGQCDTLSGRRKWGTRDRV